MDEIISPQQVIAILNRARISFVLVGAYGLAGWMEPRATQDVDVVVALKQVKKAVRLLTRAFPNLEAEEVEVVVRLRDPATGKVRIDVMKPTQQPYREIFKHTTRVAARGQEYRVPTLEMALTCKFGPMISLGRADAKKYQDAHDFIVMIKQNPAIDLAKLEHLGELLYAGGGKEILELVRRVKAGEKLEL
jgi:DhnA family fructose-bisphosphate aldolase class Ia